ncbi:tRNA (adenosine(37)-N6)-threonylcarbamoyltransferase complex ATPase subunit type 1 TsaE [Candidatus Saccharibacteria bacterium]|nr:tRNA (adenosine(37)-N6)-threonylcarbamoyltransferase complex ATPase subunit type 1 TsaE [Candidatus Saccharibacteria bacterium]
MKEKRVNSEEGMLELGKNIAKSLTVPAVIELVGDVGAGKTTLTRGIAEGLGVKEQVTSPSFTISKVYEFPGGSLVHYDFYRLGEPGLMMDDLMENMEDTRTVTVVEWADSVADVLPEKHRRIEIILNEDGSRTIKEIEK